MSLVAAAPAVAQGAPPARDYCASRPGLGTTPCTIAPGKVSVELALIDWERDRQSGSGTDSVVAGDIAVRLGIGDTIELIGAATPYGFVRTSRAGGARATDHGSGDVTFGAKVNLVHPDGAAFSLAISPFVSLPVGGKALGAGQWAGGVVVPMSYLLGESVSLQLTPEYDIAADSDGRGRHPAYSLIAGVAMAVSDAASMTHEIAIGRNLDPERGATQAFYSFSVAWTPRDDLQFDLGTVLGLNSRSPDVRFYAGIARLF